MSVTDDSVAKGNQKAQRVNGRASKSSLVYHVRLVAPILLVAVIPLRLSGFAGESSIDTAATRSACQSIRLSETSTASSTQARGLPTGRLKERWSAELGIDPVISAGLVISAENGPTGGPACVIAVSTKTGAKRWTFVDHSNSDVWGIAAAEGVVLVAFGHTPPSRCSGCLRASTVYRVDAIDELTGGLLWSLPVRRTASAGIVQYLPAVIAGSVAVIEESNGVVLGLQLKSGHELWALGRSSSSCDYQPMAGSEPRVVFVDCSDRVRAIDPGTGRLLWTSPMKSASGSFGGAVEVSAGSRAGIVAVERGILHIPPVATLGFGLGAKDSGYMPTTIVVIDSSNGQPLWALRYVPQIPVVFGAMDVLCVEGYEGVECRNATTGVLLWRLATPFVPKGYSPQLGEPVFEAGPIVYTWKPETLVSGKRVRVLESLALGNGEPIGGTTTLPKLRGTPDVEAAGEGILLVHWIGTHFPERTVALEAAR